MYRYDRRTASDDFFDKWYAIVQKYRQAEGNEFAKLVKSLAPKLKAVGLILDTNRSYVSKNWHGSDGYRMEGMLWLTENPKNEFYLSKDKVQELVQEATGIYGVAKEDGNQAWTVDISVS